MRRLNSPTPVAPRPVALRRPAPGRVDPTEFTDIQNVPETPLQLRGRPDLLPEEAALSLPDPDNVPPLMIRVLNRMLGPKVTIDNPIWSGDPVPKFRSLQKMLVERSLALPDDDRSECLEAISLVERAVQLRLRWLQMRRSDTEVDGATEEKA
jgi:hypothetical protein